MLNMRKMAVISICSVLATTTMNVPVYADTIGSILVTANIAEEGFKGEIYVIISDGKGPQRLALLSADNNFQYKIDNLNAGNYDVKEVDVFSEKNSNSKREGVDADYTITTGNLDLNEQNQSSTIIVDIHSIKTADKNKEKDDKTLNNKNDKASDNVKDDKNTSTTETTKDEEKKQEDSNNTESNNSVATRKNYIFFNFIIDAILILSIGSIWFFKVREKKKKDDE